MHIDLRRSVLDFPELLNCKQHFVIEEFLYEISESGQFVIALKFVKDVREVREGVDLILDGQVKVGEIIHYYLLNFPLL